MTTLFWFAFNQDSDRYSIGLDCWGNYLIRFVSPCGCRLEECYELFAGPEMAPYPYAGGNDDDLPF